MKLKLPKRVKIGTVTYRVLRAPLQHKHRLGEIDTLKRTITFTTARVTSDEVRETFWHEVLHGMLLNMRNNKWDDERFVTALAKRIAQVHKGLPS